MENANTRPAWVEIDLAAIAHNIRETRKHIAPAKLMAVVKANAYGHGVQEVASLALQNGADYLGVALLQEGILLRERQFHCPILVFGGFFDHQIEDFLRFNLELTLYDYDRAVALANRAADLSRPARVHIKVDTGMGRVGVAWDKAAEFVQTVSELKSIEMAGIYTHFASSDSGDKTFAETQLRRFQAVLGQLEANDIHIPLRHLANSGAVLDLPNSYYDMVRPGVMLYGYYPSPGTSKSVALKPAMAIKSRVIFLKQVPAGAPISYGLTFKADQNTTIATVPIGYGDGYNRLLSNSGQVLIRGRRFPVVGRVCMDQIMVEVGNNSTVEVGDEVVLLGRQGHEEISIYELCAKLNTIPYEITCGISQRLERRFKH
ncbi:MAG: alanine racemase [bacterium]